MIVSPCFEVKTFSPSIIYTYILIVVQINKVLFYFYCLKVWYIYTGDGEITSSFHLKAVWYVLIDFFSVC